MERKTYTTSSLPEGLTLDPTTGVVSGTPQVSGEFAIDLMVSNSHGTASGGVTLTLTQTNVPTIEVLSRRTGQQGSNVRLPYAIANMPDVVEATGFRQA